MATTTTAPSNTAPIPEYAHTSPPQPATGLARWTPSLPTSIMGMINSFTTPAETDKLDDDTNGNANANAHQRSGALLERPVERPAPPSPTRSGASIMFAEPDTRSNSDDGSREGSIDGRQLLRKNTRPKTRFSICHPPPESKVKQKLHRRTRSLMQLHRLQSGARPLPALDVIPSAQFSVRLTRAITKVFKAKHALCPNDLVVLKAEKYSGDELDEDRQAQDVIGLICKGQKGDEKAVQGKMTIHFASGQAWEAYSTPIGGYECFAADEHGLGETIRWVPKKNKEGTKAAREGLRRFNFSTISPHSRRHPVIASLSQSGLDINDTYKIPEPKVSTPLGTPKADVTILADAVEDEEGDKDLCETDDRLRNIITVTAIWVAFREGWSPSFKYDERQRDQESPTPQSPRRSTSNLASTPPGSPRMSGIKSVGSDIIRRTSLLGRNQRNSTVSVPEESEPESRSPSRNPSVNLGKSGRSRADSSSTVLVHRAASNRRKNNNNISAFRPDLGAAEDLQEASYEDLARDAKTNPEPKRTRSPLLSMTERRVTSGSPALVEEENGRRSRKSKIRPRSITPDKPGHRESTTTDDTSSSPPLQQGSHPMPKRMQPKKKSKGWRKLFCGSADK